MKRERSPWEITSNKEEVINEFIELLQLEPNITVSKLAEWVYNKGYAIKFKLIQND